MDFSTTYSNSFWLFIITKEQLSLVMLVLSSDKLNLTAASNVFILANVVDIDRDQLGHTNIAIYWTQAPGSTQCYISSFTDIPLIYIKFTTLLTGLNYCN